MVSRARVASDDCEHLIGALNNELCAIKVQLTDLTKSLSIPVEHPPPPPFRPSHCPSPLIYRPPRRSKDYTGRSVCVSTEQPPLKPSPPATTSRHKEEHRKAKTPSNATGGSDSVPAMHLLRVVDERETERAKARACYLALMRDHIENQLRDFVDRENLRRKRKERREKQARAASKQLKPPRLRSTGVDDKSYLENLYQSCLYKIIGVEQGMKKCGKLKTLRELKEFWEQMLTPLQATPSKYKRTRFPVSSLWRGKQMEEEEEATNSWALTASKPEANQFGDTFQHMPPSPTPTPLRFTPCKLPELIPISEILDEDVEVGLSSICQPISHHSQSPITKQRVLIQKVYQRAKANEIAMRSLLPHGMTIERPTFEVCEQSVSPRVVTSTHRSPAVLPPLSHAPKPPVHPDATLPDPQTTLKHTIKNQDLELRCQSRGSSYSGNLQLHPLSVNMTASRESLLSPFQSQLSSKPVCIPLTMSELLENSVTKEVAVKKPLLWSNYQL